MATTSDEPWTPVEWAINGVKVRNFLDRLYKQGWEIRPTTDEWKNNLEDGIERTVALKRKDEWRIDSFVFLVRGCLRYNAIWAGHELFRTLMKTTGLHILSYIELYYVRTNLTSFFSLSSVYSMPSDAFCAVATSWSWVCSYDGI